MSLFTIDPKPGMRAGIFVLFLAILGLDPSHAQTLMASPGFTTDTTTDPTNYTATLPAGGSAPTLPGSVELSTIGSADLIDLSVTLNQDASYDATGNYASLFTFTNEMGRLKVTSNNALTLTNVLTLRDTNATGNAAILAIGAPNPNRDPGIGQEVDVTINENITVFGIGGFDGTSPLTLEPPGFRTAQLSGVTAVSYGLQDSNNDHSRTGGTVNVTTKEGTKIEVVQLFFSTAAGISASSAAGPAKNNYLNDPSGIHAVNITQNGDIEVTVDQGMGIFANTTGAQYPTSDNSAPAVGGDVTVTLTTNADGMGGANIKHSGQTGIGIFALSEVSPVNDTSSIAIQGGDVSVTLEKETGIEVGITLGVSEFSIGVLAVSASGNELLNPFSTSTTPLDTKGQGSGGTVTVDNSGSIDAFGTSSVGVAALSIGGASMVTTSNPSTNENSYLGSNGAHIGDGDQVTVTNQQEGSIVTNGQGAHGIIALSTANGGVINNLQEVAIAGPLDRTGLIIGNGPSSVSGSGRDGGDVTVTNSGTITTGDGSNDSAASIGIVAQSIGGGGGNASNKASLFVGDSGGAGGDGGTVNVTTQEGSSLTTHDVNSIGILAQSIGGGGGNGGNAEGLFFAVGGRGGGGGDGGEIDFTFDGALNTKQSHSGGVIAHSIGGGGGHGGAATSMGFLLLSTGVGGNGGSGGEGGAVTTTIDQDATITTLGNNSAGITLQSIGGGGGTGGAASGISESLALSVAIAVGGSGGDGGSGGTADLTNHGSITTGDASAASPNGAPVNAGADSIGAIVQSIGGGGGHGGSALADALSIDGGEDLPFAVSLSFGFSGSGGGAGNGDDVTFNHDGAITTWGDGSHGALLQSIGGGGGSGGDSTAYSAALAVEADSVTLSIAHGGSGGSGGDGNSVTVNTSQDVANGLPGTITTNGQNAAGLVAQSIGGGGGNGGLGTAKASNENLSEDGGTSLTSELALGGAGGSGGNAGPVSITHDGVINTDGSGSQGILAQAIGGGGGNAGGGSVGGGNVNYEVDVAIGGSGGSGGDAKNSDSTNISVAVENLGFIQTKKGDSSGIVAQSIGGGGGTGGSSDVQAPTGIIGNVIDTIFPSSTYNSTISVGGSGGGGGQGGTVAVRNEDQIETEGSRSYGMVAQSISGGGGIGGSANASSNSAIVTSVMPDRYNNYSINIAVGGKGGSGHTGGKAGVENFTSVTTSGYASHGIVAQSIGGGGGIGADGSLDTRTTMNLGIEVDQGDGSAAAGGTVTVTQARTVSTSGHHSNGVVAQSIGGGGGIGSQGTDLAPLTVKPNVGVSPNLNIGLNLGININTSDDSDGGATTVNLGDPSFLLSNSTSTQGDWSIGALAQSIGAGGGKADTLSGSNVSIIPTLDLVLGAQKGNGKGGEVVVASTGDSTVMTGSSTGGFGAYGILAQSIGGGGGIATDASSAATGSMTLGGGHGAQAGSVNGDGGTVTMTADNLSVHTQGSVAHGVVLQSIGGGGGVAGSGATEAYAENLSGVAAPKLTLGGKDSTGNSDTVTLTGSVSVNTTGENAFGLVAQSIGGGGGIATAKQTGGMVDLGLTADDTSQRQGGTVNLTLSNDSTIQTSGAGSHGLVAQSIGGGGGIANPDASSGLDLGVPTRSATAHGYGQDVKLDLSGDITTSGDGAYGVIAQVIGGGGGLYNNFAGSTGGANSSSDASNNGTLNITLESDASIQTSGQNTHAILAQNITGDGNSGREIMITVNGQVQSEKGSGILVEGGDDNNNLTINAGGSVITQDLTQEAIRYRGKENFNISNSGEIAGNISIQNSPDADSTFTNETGGIFISGNFVNATMEDSGTFTVGGDSQLLQTEMVRNYTQNSGGLLQFEIESVSSFDQLVFEAAYGDFQGDIEISVLNQGRDLSAGDRMILVTSSDGPTANIFDPSFIASAVFSERPDDFVFLLFEDEGALVLDVIAVPEPSTAGLITLAAFGWLLRRRGKS